MGGCCGGVVVVGSVLSPGRTVSVSASGRRFCLALDVSISSEQQRSSPSVETIVPTTRLPYTVYIVQPQFDLVNAMSIPVPSV